MTTLSSYVRKNSQIPQWMQVSVKFTRTLYSQNIHICDNWVKKINKQYNSWQILEWRGEKEKLDISEHLVQFRASGIRILKKNVAPSLISMTPTQIPIIHSEFRYVSKHEAAKLQYLQELKFLPNGTTAAFKALGNAVNAKIIELISYSFNKLAHT